MVAAVMNTRRPSRTDATSPTRTLSYTFDREAEEVGDLVDGVDETARRCPHADRGTRLALGADRAEPQRWVVASYFCGSRPSLCPGSNHPPNQPNRIRKGTFRAVD